MWVFVGVGVCVSLLMFVLVYTSSMLPYNSSGFQLLYTHDEVNATLPCPAHELVVELKS